MNTSGYVIPKQEVEVWVTIETWRASGTKKTATSINTTQTAARIAQSVLGLGYTLDETRIMTAFLEGGEIPKCPGLL